MNCPYCARDILLVKEQETYASVYYCQNCRTELTVISDIKDDDQAFEWKQYRILCNTKSNRAHIQKLYMDILSDTSIIFRWYTVVELPNIPQNLTKDTIEQKLKMYLLFS